ncbi:MAG: hypothetical protein KAR20_05030 [Candidatus Heimdallarchaeota archaeon]|nr:hypothetical protein [Candidatus Heimdallarchaeota archaeon]
MVDFSGEGGFSTSDPEVLMKWNQFVYFEKGISARDFKKEKLSDIMFNVEIKSAMDRKVERLRRIEEMKRAAKG